MMERVAEVQEPQVPTYLPTTWVQQVELELRIRSQARDYILPEVVGVANRDQVLRVMAD
jgi:hypothetical protein